MLLSTKAHRDYTWGVIKPTGAAVFGEQSRGSLYHVAHVAPSPGASNSAYLTLLFPCDTWAIHFWLLNLHTTFVNKLFLIEYENL